MTNLFTLDVMIGYVEPIQDEPYFFPAITLKLLRFPSLTVHCISPSEQQELKKNFYSDNTSSNKIGIRGPQNRIVFKKGKSCSFKLAKQDAQKLYFPLTIILNDAWYLPVKELARTCIDILIPHFKQGSVIPPIKSNKQVYELYNASGSKVAMIELSYKLKRIQNDVSGAASSHKAKPVFNKEFPSKKVILESSLHTKDTVFPQKPTDDTSVNKLLDKLTICPPPLQYSANSNKDQVKRQPEVEPVTHQNVSQVVWPNGYVHVEPAVNVSKEDDVLLPSCPQYVVPPVVQDEATVDSNQNFWILKALMKELSAMEQLLKSNGVSHPARNCNDVYVQTDNLSSSSSHSEMSDKNKNDKSTTTDIVTKKTMRQKKKFTRECCVAAKQSTNNPVKLKPRNVTTSPQNKITSPKIKTTYQMSSPRNKTTPSTIYEKRAQKAKLTSPLKQKPPPQLQLDSAVSRVSQITSDENSKSDGSSKNDKNTSEEFSVNASVKHNGDQSKLNLEIHLPTMTKIPSTTTISLKQDDGISSIADDGTTAILTAPPDTITSSITPMPSGTQLTPSQSSVPMASVMPLRLASHSVTPASQSEHLTLASSNGEQSYADLSLSQSSEDVLNQSHISNLMFSTKHLEAVLADGKSTKPVSPITDRDKPNSSVAISPATSGSESVQYIDDFESSDCSSKETLSSKTS